MFELTEMMLTQLVKLLPAMFGVYLIFNFTRDLLFKE